MASQVRHLITEAELELEQMELKTVVQDSDYHRVRAEIYAKLALAAATAAPTSVL